MKKLLPFLLLLPLALLQGDLAKTQGVAISGLAKLQGTAPGGGACATTDSTLPQDVFIEGFNAPGYELSWAESGTTANIDDAFDSSSFGSGKPTGACDGALEITVPNDGTETYTSYTDTFTLASNLDLFFYLWIPASGGPPDTTDMRIFVACNNVAPASFQRARIHLVNTSGTYTIYASGGTTSTSITVSTGTWHKVKLHLNTTLASSFIQMDDGTEYTFTRGSGTTMSYVHVGGCEGVDAGEGGDVYFDLVTGDQP